MGKKRRRISKWVAHTDQSKTEYVRTQREQSLTGIRSVNDVASSNNEKVGMPQRNEKKLIKLPMDGTCL